MHETAIIFNSNSKCCIMEGNEGTKKCSNEVVLYCCKRLLREKCKNSGVFPPDETWQQFFKIVVDNLEDGVIEKVQAYVWEYQLGEGVGDEEETLLEGMQDDMYQMCLDWGNSKPPQSRLSGIDIVGGQLQKPRFSNELMLHLFKRLMCDWCPFVGELPSDMELQRVYDAAVGNQEEGVLEKVQEFLWDRQFGPRTENEDGLDSTNRIVTEMYDLCYLHATSTQGKIGCAEDTVNICTVIELETADGLSSNQVKKELKDASTFSGNIYLKRLQFNYGMLLDRDEGEDAKYDLSTPKKKKRYCVLVKKFFKESMRSRLVSESGDQPTEDQIDSCLDVLVDFMMPVAEVDNLAKHLHEGMHLIDTKKKKLRHEELNLMLVELVSHNVKRLEMLREYNKELLNEWAGKKILN